MKKGDPMSINPNVHLRLRRSTHDKLRAALELSAHRSLSSLADEILDEGLTRRLEKATDDDLARATMLELARRNG